MSFDARAFLKTVPECPGVYRMINASGEVIYVGKANDLKKRLSSYFRKHLPSAKTRALVEEIASIELTTTDSEIEALLLEQNQIKAYRPKYNILLRDDKSYPYIFLSSHAWPRLAKYRGAKRENGEYFGPFPSGVAVKETLALAQKLFKVRQCEDTVFANRTRPCLEYQIGRCKAPCVGMVSAEEYARDVELTRDLIRGAGQEVIHKLVAQMEALSAQLEYEKAAVVRDQIKALRHVTSEQAIEEGHADADVIACVERDGMAAIHVLFVRGGRVIGSRNHFIDLIEPMDVALTQFLGQFYGEGRQIPGQILINHLPSDIETLSRWLHRLAGHHIAIRHSVRGIRKKWVSLAENNAKASLERHRQSRHVMESRWVQLAEWLGLSRLPKRIECMDVSHSHGEEARVSLVVFGQDGPDKKQYRQYHVTGITAGDDYAAIRQAIERRFSGDPNFFPDVFIIDGGKAQVAAVVEMWSSLAINEPPILLGLAKGPERRVGLEEVWRWHNDNIHRINPVHYPDAFYLLLQIRDEAHRFALKSHRRARAKKRKHSTLEMIPGIGPVRRKQLLMHFGGIEALKKATIKDLASVPGIGPHHAEQIYAYLHED